MRWHLARLHFVFIYFFSSVLGNGVGFANNYIIISFLSWVPNLLLVEWINHHYRKRNICC